MSEYICLNSDKMEQKIGLILELWHNFLQRTVSAYVSEYNEMGQCCENLENCDAKEIYYVNVVTLREIFERTHQREDYFERYHNKLQMSNFKEIGLIAFWISKLKPFHLKEEYAEEQGYGYSLKHINSELYNELLYTMQYRDLSKEAFGCIVELISIATRKM